MKKLFLFIILMIIFRGTVPAQQPTLWQSLPLDFNYYPTHILNDSAHDVAYLYGSFDRVGNDTCNIIRMDSSGFTLMPPAPVNVYSGIKAALYHGKLYVCGTYSDIFVWDGSSWDTIPVLGNVTCLYRHFNKLYACGSFDSIAHTYVNNLAVWNDTTWTDVPGLDAFLDVDNSLIYNLIWYKGELYVSGVLLKQGNAQMRTLIRFDGQHWQDVEGQIAGNQSPRIKDMLVWRDTLYVSGTFRESNGGAGNGIAKWDGQNWHSLQQGVFIGDQPTVSDMMVFNDELYVAGWFNTINGVSYPIPFPWTTGIAKWDGTKWCSLGARVHGAIWALGQFHDSLYVMGQFDTLNNQPIKYMAKWIGGDYTDSCIMQPTGISGPLQTAQNNLSLYPNPANHLLNVSVQNTFSSAEEGWIQITDITGRVVQVKAIKLKPGAHDYRLNIRKLVPGMYLMKIHTGRETKLAKFVKL